MKTKFFLIIVIYFIIFAPKVFAVETPNFPLCTSPQGDVIASYKEGTHGVPGATSEYLGEDVVYKINENQVLQCLCTIDGQGIQTNWWQFEALSENQIAILKSQGWIFVPDGSLWGLKNVPYFAKNAGYACRPEVQQVGGRDVLGKGIGLAPTGNLTFIFGILLAGITLVIAGLLLRPKALSTSSKKKKMGPVNVRL